MNMLGEKKNCLEWSAINSILFSVDGEYETKNFLHRSHSDTLYSVVQVLFAPFSWFYLGRKKCGFFVCAVILQAFYFLVRENILLQYADR